MKKAFSLLLALCMLVINAGAMADGMYKMAGYDPTSVGHDWNNNFFFQRMEERTGIQFSFTQYTELSAWTADKQQLKADGELPDVLFKAELSAAETQKLYADGVLIDLRPYLAEYAPNLSALLAEHPDWAKQITLPGGEIVALPYINPLQNTNAIWINTEWLRNVGKEMPATAEEFADVLRAFKADDPNRNGKEDEKPLTFTGMWDLRFLAHAFGIYSNDYYVTLEDGVVRETVTSDENRAFLTWLHEMYAEGLIDRNGFITGDSTRKLSDSTNSFTGTSSAATIIYGVVFGPSPLSMLPNSQLDKYAVLLPLAYNGKQVYRDLFGDVVCGAFAITSACKDPAALVAWADFLYSEEGIFLAQAGLKDEEYEIHSDGTWSWIDDAKRVTEVILPEYTIAEGGAIPGYTPLSYQLNYDDSSTHKAVVMLSELKALSVLPYPQVYLDDQTRSRLAGMWLEISNYAETAMARFVTGDVPLTDASWQEFCATLRQLGLDDTVAIWQEAVR